MLIREEVRARREMHKLFQSVSLSPSLCSKYETDPVQTRILLIFCHQTIRALLNEIQHVISLCTCRGLRPEEISDGKRFVSGLREPTCTVKKQFS